MKKIINIAAFFILCVVGISLVACDDLQSTVVDQSNNQAGSGGLYILSDGNYSLNNSTLALHDFAKKTFQADYFQAVNGRKLGDTGNDLQRYGSKLYVVVNGSSQLEVLDARTGRSLKQIPLFNGNVARQPRSIAFWEDKAYVCCFDGTVAKLDTASLAIEGGIQVGRNPDGIAAANNKLYVSNSGGLDYGSNQGYDHTVSVISTESFTELKRIEVGLNPGRIKADTYGYVYVSVRGNYDDIANTWVCIDVQNDVVYDTYALEVTNFDFAGEHAYFYCWDEASGENKIGVFNLLSHQLETLHFISDGTRIKTPYGIYADVEFGKIYITDAGDFVASGDVYCFNQNGHRLSTFQNVGVNPNTVLYVPDFVGADGVAVDTGAALSGIEKVWDFTPAPGQFVGVYPSYIAGQNKEAMRAVAESKLEGTKGGTVSLGSYGGSVTFSFHSAVNNLAGADFKVFGNAFYNSAEPGIVEVSEDVNGNGLPDDAWYELAGSEYAKSSTLHGYRITYFRPNGLKDSVLCKDNRGAISYIRGAYPAWEGDSIVCGGSLVAPSAYQSDAQYWVLANLAWGYADNQPNSSDLVGMDLDWAVDSAGDAVHLSKIHFVRVYTGVNQRLGWLGELSTEVTGAENLHP